MDWFDNGRVDRLYRRACYEGALDLLPEGFGDSSLVEKQIRRALCAWAVCDDATPTSAVRLTPAPDELSTSVALEAASSAASPEGTPAAWLRRVAREAASTLSDGTVPVSIAYVAARSRFPRAVMTGSFVCMACSRPPGGPDPKGSVAVMRLDGKTHGSLDFGLCREPALCEASLCSGFPCSRARLALDAALLALADRRGDSAPFGQKLGTSKCHVTFSVRKSRYVIGTCTTAIRLLGAHAAIVRFTEDWAREYRHGRWVEVPLRTHTWRALVTDGGWKTRITSSGDPAPPVAR